MTINYSQRTEITETLADLREKTDAKSVELTNMFDAMQSKEEQVGYGLIYAKTGKPIPDKLVERFIRRQRTQAEQVSSMRLKFIKLKGMVQEKLDAINKLDNLENNLHLGDYEQLKVENRSHADKMEEREEELTRLRAKCQNTTQILAHMREKSSALDSDLCDLHEEFFVVDNTARELRETLASLKHERDKYRKMAKKVKDESGLLVKANLLKDMEKSKQECENLEEQFNTCIRDVESTKKYVAKMRKRISQITDDLSAKKCFQKKVKKQNERTILKGKYDRTKRVYNQQLTEFHPIIKQSAFDDLVHIKASPFVYNRRKR